jgi:uncharacterized protein (DUF433 family)
MVPYSLLLSSPFDGHSKNGHFRVMNAAIADVGIGALITRTPGIKGGSPHIAGTGVTVRTIVRWHRSGLVPEEIAARIGHLSMAQVHAALTFYYANQEMMDREMAQEEAESDRLEREHLARHPRTPAPP